MRQPDPVYDIVDVVHEIADCHPIDPRPSLYEKRHCRHADHPPAVPQRIQHLVIHIARHVTQCLHTGMGRNHRRARQHRRLQHPLLRNMRHVHQQAQPVHFRHRIAPQRTQATMQMRLILQIPPWIAAIGQRVMPVMRKGHVYAAQCPEPGQHAQILADRMPVLHARQHGDGPVPHCRLHRVGSRAHPRRHAVLRAPIPVDDIQHRQRPVPRHGIALRRAWPLRHIRGKAPGPQPACLHLAKLHLPRTDQKRVCLRRRWPRDIDMRIERQQTVVQINLHPAQGACAPAENPCMDAP